jgi:hypothetical protein
MVWRPWPLFDPFLSRRETLLTGGPVWERPTAAPRTLAGFEGSFGKAMETRSGLLTLRLEEEGGLRWTGGGHGVFFFPRFTYAGGLVVGPFDFTARAGVTVLEVHAGSGGFGVGLFSPRVSAGAAVRIGRLRLGAVAFSEYAWRWFGGPSAGVEGVLLEASLRTLPPGLPRYYRIEK